MSITSLVKPVLLVLSLFTPLLSSAPGGPNEPVRYIGLHVLVDSEEIAHSGKLERITGRLL